MAAADMASALRQVRTGAGTPAARVWLALGTVYLLWGSTYLGIKYALETMPPLLMGSLRFLAAGGVLYLLAIRQGDTAGDRPGSRPADGPHEHGPERDIQPGRLTSRAGSQRWQEPLRVGR